MKKLLLVALLWSSTASATPPWFSQSGAETMVAAGLPDYFASLQELAATDPARYQEKLHAAMMLLISGEQNPEVLAAWKSKFAAEQRYRSLVVAWQAASPAQRPALRDRILDASADIEDARLAYFEAKLPIAERRLMMLESDLEDVEINLEAYALERVQNSLKEPSVLGEAAAQR